MTTYDKYLFDCEKFRRDASEKFLMDAMAEQMAENLRRMLDQEFMELSEKFRAAK